MDRNLEPTGALAEILAKTGELDRILSGGGLTFEPARQLGPTPPPPRPLVIMPADWEPDVHEDVTATPVATEENPGPPPRREPIDTGRIASATPRLDEARAWMSSQMRGDRP